MGHTTPYRRPGRRPAADTGWSDYWALGPLGPVEFAYLAGRSERVVAETLVAWYGRRGARVAARVYRAYRARISAAHTDVDDSP